MDTWSISTSADTSNIGFTTTVNYAMGFEHKLPNFNADIGAVVAVTRTTLQTLPFETKVYSQAKKYMESGGLGTNFNNIEPILYTSVAESRSAAWGKMIANVPSDVLEKTTAAKLGCDDWNCGSNAWTPEAIINDLCSRFGMDVDISDVPSIFKNYYIGTYTVEPYGNILSELRKLFAGFPLLFIWKGGFGSSAKLVLKAPAQRMGVPLYFKPHTSMSSRFSPQKKTCVVLYGGLGMPEGFTAPTGESNIENIINFSDYLPNYISTSSITFADPTPDGEYQIGSKFKHSLTGNLTIAVPSFNDKVQGRLEKFKPSSMATSHAEDNALLTAVTSRYVVYNLNATPVATLTSFSKSQVQSTYDEIYMKPAPVATPYISSTCSAQAIDYRLVAYGESMNDARSIEITKRAVSFGESFLTGNPDAPKWTFPIEYSVSTTYYEDLFGEKIGGEESKIASVGRKAKKVSCNYKLWKVTDTGVTADGKLKSRASGMGMSAARSETGINPDIDYFEPGFKLFFVLTRRTTETFDPAGASGYNRSVVVDTINEATGNYTSKIEDGAGDPGANISQTPMGPGYARIIAKTGEGDPDRVSLPVCDRKQAQELADLLLTYQKGYTQITTVVEEPKCHTDSSGNTTTDSTIDIPPRNDYPGDMTETGTLISISINESPLKRTTTWVTRYYPYDF